MANKVIYLITTYKCSACKLQKHLLQTALVGCDHIKLEECDFNDAPEFIKINVKLTDFPTTVLVENDVIKYHFVGTKSVKAFNELMVDIKF